MPAYEEEALSVSAALNRAKRTLDSLPLCIEGEVSEVSNKPGYKAVYFTIKDTSACLPCMMWMNKFNQTGIDLRVGALVQVKGKLSIYAPKGRMTFEVSSMSLAGEGALRQKIAMLAKKLESEGLTSSERKRPLPNLPQTIGLVTSPRGDAVHDVLRTLRRRFPAARVVFAGVPVEGPGAASNIVDGIVAVVKANAEVCLVVRGGGSFEDLMPFNDERLARTIAACPIPVVTGIGHEPDTTIADLVSDVRASTPTAAAEKVSPAEGELAARLEDATSKLDRVISGALSHSELLLESRANRPLFADSSALFGSAWLGLDMNSERLSHAIPANLQRDEQALALAQSKIVASARTALMKYDAALGKTSTKMRSLSDKSLSRATNELAVRAAAVQSLSPLAILSRGYSVAYDAAGKVISTSDGVSSGDAVNVRLGKGSLNCSVVSVSQ